MNYVWLFLLLGALLLFLLYYKPSLHQDSTFPIGNVQCTNHTSLTFEVFIIDQEGNFIVMSDKNGNPLLVSPQSYFVYPFQDRVHLCAIRPDLIGTGIKSFYGTVLSNQNGSLHISYWGESKESDWVFTRTDLPATPTTFISRKDVNDVSLVDHSSIKKSLQSLYTTMKTVCNYNTSPVELYVFSSKSSLNHKKYILASNESVLLDLPDHAILIALAKNGGIQGVELQDTLYHLFGPSNAIHVI
jgi:hypothetical protein